MVVYNLTTGRVRCTNESTKATAFTLMPEGHEMSAIALDNALWEDSARLLRLEKKGIVRIDRNQDRKPVLAAAPDMEDLTKAQRAMINGLVLGSDIEYQSYIDMIPLDNRADMPERPNYRYVREKMVPAFEIAETWLRDINTASSKKRESAVHKRIKELNTLVSANTR